MTGPGQAPTQGTSPRGRVVLVGAGPGAPDLLTVRALRHLQEAEVVLYDNLISAEILALIPAGAERIDVGKRRSRHTLPQAELNTLMVRLAHEGRRVVRLKSGDPFVFGRGGEELEALVAAGIECELVPGITAAIGAAAAAGIPLTHREWAQACTLVTGNLQDGSLDLDWPALARPRQTLAIYMGLLGLPLLCQRLIEHGRDPATPAAVVEKATRPGQRIVCATLRDLPDEVEKAGLHAPTLILVGEVVRLHATLGRVLGEPAP